MSSNIYYRRWDGVLVSLELGNRHITINGEQYEKVVDAVICRDSEPAEPEYACSDIVRIKEDGTLYYCIIRTGRSNVCMTFDFYNSKVDGIQCSIVVDSLEQYIKVLDYYRFCSLVNRIQCIQARCTVQVDMVAVTKCLDAVHRRGDVYSERLDDCLIALKNALKDANMKDEIIRDEIEHAIDVYEQGGAFCYYRGVGSSIYPEKPGISGISISGKKIDGIGR